MEYGRLVVLGYSSYRVATVRNPRAEAERERGARNSAVSREPPGTITGIEHAPNGHKVRAPVCQLWEPIGDQNAHYVLQKRRRANGVKLARFHQLCGSVDDRKDMKDATKRMMEALDARRGDRPEAFHMCVPMNDHDPHASITEYAADEETDMFQIGRMPCRQNDFVIPGPRVGASGTISRFAARIVCSRTFPFECRIYAGGFDVSRKMTTAGHALKYCAVCSTWTKNVPMKHGCVTGTALRCVSDTRDNQFEHMVEVGGRLDGFNHIEMATTDASKVPVDGLTKNGVRVWLPEHTQWFEVSVNGNLYAIEPRQSSASSSSSLARASRSRDCSQIRHSAFNRPVGGMDAAASSVLTNGAIIDLGGVQLQFQTVHVVEENNNSPDIPVGTDVDEATSVVSKLELMNVQCPVQLHSLRFAKPLDGEEVELDQIPNVFPACGHVFGYEERIAHSKTCPLCRTPGNLVPLLLKENSKLQPAKERNTVPECVFNPCGHAITKSLAQRYSSILMPNGRAICPFCAVHLDPTTPFSRLFLYRDEEADAR
ncbi:TPA: hypothetical protein N0F65_008854 [Lagenidium giganteum]|uniref:Uncharacterized protein n=1 Tax=Lagenidium giganteum TaxID=4803 RepID=A0AAV2YUC6_9STRA|nr:TPA: hypothetical protein N0F65_008854 [Lagenidium giganteum]